MNRFVNSVVSTAQGLIKAVTRFPLTVLCLVCATSIMCYTISLHTKEDLFIQKLLFTFGLGAFISVAAQFCFERFRRLRKFRLIVYLAAALLILGYYLIIAKVPDITYSVTARTVVAVFAVFCIYIWIPSFKGKSDLKDDVDFNSLALIHFKAAITSILYSAILFAGVSSIIATVNELLFKVSEDFYGYSAAVIWITFAVIYYLSRLPRFNSETEEDKEDIEQSAVYPKVLKILISYIIIPLIAVYSIVLISYFVKILITFKWPSGMLGPMILAYSIAGLIVYVLASHLDDKFASGYRRIFPKVLILMVVMQLISVSLRLNAFGVTEGRYYLALFGIYSLICGIVLSIKPVAGNYIIALLGAGLAIISILPPVDAFSVSRNSQISRLEHMLTSNGILSGGKIIPKSDASLELRQETTSILSYLANRSYLRYVSWLPEDLKSAKAKPYEGVSKEKMAAIFGFEPAYEGVRPNAQYFYAGLNMNEPLSISGYDVVVGINAYRNMPDSKDGISVREVKVGDNSYRITAERLSVKDARVSVKDVSGTELVGTNLYETAKTLSGVGSEQKEALGPEAMSINIDKNGYRMKVVFQNVNMNLTGDSGADYDLFVFFGVDNGKAE